MKAIKEMKKNEHAVSPIVATLVLIVVAVVGAVAVGTIMGTFSSDVAKENNAGDVAGASATEILVAGSTSIQPVAQTGANLYMKERPGVKVTVQAGGSGAGLSAVVNKVVDIGMMSEDMTKTQKTAYPTIVQHQIGASGVVLIAHPSNTITTGNTSDLKNAYSSTSVIANLGNTSVVYGRSDKSGTADTFAKLIGLPEDAIYTAGIATESGNGNLVKKVAATPGAIGFTDSEFAIGRTDVKIVAFDHKGTVMTLPLTVSAIKAAYLGQTSTFPKDATRPLFLLTNGEPNSVVKSYITFMQSPAMKTEFNNAYMVHTSEIVVS